MNDINTRGTAETSCPSNDIGSIPDEKDEMKKEKTDPPKSTSSKMFEIRVNGLCFYIYKASRLHLIPCKLSLFQFQHLILNGILTLLHHQAVQIEKRNSIQSRLQLQGAKHAEIFP